MRTPDGIKKGLECCIEGRCCKCPYEQVCDEHLAEGGDVIPAKEPLVDFLALIQQLERERDAAVKAMKYMAKDLEVGICCETCSHYAYDEEDESSICSDCDVDSNWQWRGVQEVE